MTKILILEDKPEIQQLLATTFAIGDYELNQYGTAEEGLAALEQQTPDLVLMDIMLPGKLNGIEATRIIKRERKLDCQVLILSAKGQKTDVQAGLDAGASDYFIKPFSPAELIRKVEELLGSGR